MRRTSRLASPAILVGLAAVGVAIWGCGVEARREAQRLGRVHVAESPTKPDAQAGIAAAGEQFSAKYKAPAGGMAGGGGAMMKSAAGDGMMGMMGGMTKSEARAARRLTRSTDRAERRLVEYERASNSNTNA